MLLLKHMRGWSYAVLTREVRANLLYREFTRIGGTTVVDDKTMGRLARQMGPERIAEIHQRVGDGLLPLLQGIAHHILIVAGDDVPVRVGGV